MLHLPLPLPHVRTLFRGLELLVPLFYVKVSNQFNRLLQIQPHRFGWDYCGVAEDRTRVRQKYVSAFFHMIG